MDYRKLALASASMSNFHRHLMQNAENMQRIMQYETYWDFYNGIQWINRSPNDKNKLKTINYCKAIIDRHVEFLVRNGFDIVIPDIPDTPENEQESRQFQKNYLDDAWRRNDKNLFLFLLAQTGFVTGDTWIRVSWVGDDIYDNSSFDASENNYVKLDVIPPSFVYPVVGGPYGVDKDNIQEITILYPVYKRIESKKFFSYDTHFEDNIVVKSETWTKNTVTYREGKDSEVTKEHFYGEIPLIHIPNWLQGSNYYGYSDLAEIIDIQRTYNEKTSDLCRMLDYYGHPTTVIIGATPSNLSRAEDRVWFMPEGTEVENLEMQNSLAAGLEFRDALRSDLFELSSTPDDALGRKNDKSQADNTSAISYHYMPMTDKRDVKQNLYSKGLEKVNELIMKTLEMKDQNFRKQMDALKKYGTHIYRNQVIFKETLPRNEQMERSNAETDLRLGLTTRERELRRRGCGDSDAKFIVEEAKKEMKEELETKLQLENQYAIKVNAGSNNSDSTKQNAGNKSPTRPEQEIQGNKVSLTSEKKVQ